MLTVLKKEHANLNKQAVDLNEEGMLIATWCKRLHDTCPNLATDPAHRKEYMELLSAINAYGTRVDAYAVRTKHVVAIAEKFEKIVQSSSRLDYVATLGITTDVTRWHNNTKKLLANIASERELAQSKLNTN